MTTLTNDPSTARHDPAAAGCAPVLDDSRRVVASREGFCGRPDDATLAEAHRLARRVARRMLGSDARDGLDAEDVAQVVLLRFADIDLATLGNWRAWITTITRNRALDLLRAERRHGHEALGDSRDPQDQRADAPLPRQLRQLGPSGEVMARMALRQSAAVLGPRERQVLMAHLHGWSNQEIAHRLGYASPGSVAVILTRARRRVRTAFPEGPERSLLLGDVRGLY